MRVYQSFKRKLREFTACQSGTTAIIFSLAAIPLFASVGAAIDYGRQVDAKAHLTSALDAASLAGAAAAGASNSQREKIVRDAFFANMEANYPDGLQAVLDIKVQDGFLTASASYDMPTSFMNLVGISSGRVSSSNEVNINPTKKAEIALVLDYSGSMNEKVSDGVKYVSMQKAAVKLVDDVAKLGQDRLKIGLVPFSHQVYVSLPAKFVRGQTGSGGWTGCTVDRKAPWNTTVAMPDVSNDDSKWGQAQAPDHIDWGCNGYKNDGNGYVRHNLKVKPLSTDYDALKSQLKAMTPYAWTNITVGFEFGYQMLTSNDVFGGASSNDTEKFLVVLTDGAQTEPAYDEVDNLKHAVSVKRGEQNLEKLCASAKSENITVVTVAFDLQDNDPSRAKATKGRLKNCATSVEHYFDAKDGKDVSAAFSSITAEVAQNIYLSK